MKKMPKIICGLAIASVLTVSAIQITRAKEVTVVMDGEVIESSVSARLSGGRTLVPMRAIFEAFGMTVDYDDDTKVITAANSETNIVLTCGEKEMTIDGEVYEMDVVPVIESGTTLVPLRAVAEALDAVVNWNQETMTAQIDTKQDEIDDSWKENTGTIDFDSMTVTGDGAYVSGKVITITAGGDFTVTGTASDAMIYVNTVSRVKLRLSGMSLTNKSGPAIFFENSDKGFITVSKGTQNSVKGGGEYSVDAKAAIFSNDDLEIKGEGTLTVVSESHHAIASDDDVKIEEGTLNLTATDGDGIHANNKVEISGGSITITSAGDGIQAEEDVVISGGDISVTATGEVSEENGFGDFGGMGGGPRFDRQNENGDENNGEMPTMPEGAEPPENGEMPSMPDGVEPPQMGEQPQDEAPSMPDGMERSENEEDEDSESTSSKGIKAGESLTISGGTVSVAANDHAIHSSGTIDISGGEITVQSEKAKGISAHGDVNILGGTIEVKKSTEGIESKANMVISGGTINITASDDGINCGGTNGQDVRDAQGTGETGHDLTISGGSIYVNASGDGLDANGIIYIKGGETVVDGPENNGNGALDSGSDIVVDGGTIIALGASGMAETPGMKSTQPSFTVTETFDAGDKIVIKNSAGAELYSYTAVKSGDSIIFSSPELKIGEKYTVTVGDTAVEVDQSAVTAAVGGNSGMMNNNPGNMGGGPGGGFGGMGGGKPF